MENMEEWVDDFDQLYTDKKSLALLVYCSLLLMLYSHKTEKNKCETTLF